ncbi:MAG: discoidin domain-containing protein, partial [Spirochaetia bacterium]|nr:discoidin domain-containing protein [Spirochaetia bacterium]
MKYTVISRPEIFTGGIHSVSSEYDSKTAAANLMSNTGVWSTGHKEFAANEYVIIDYAKKIDINFIELVPSSIGAKTFPRNFRFEWSDDLDVWHILHSENGYEPEDIPYHIYLPVTGFRYLKLVITMPPFFNEKYYAEIGSLRAGISGVKEVSASSALEGHSAANLFDNGKTSWASKFSAGSSIEHITVDLGNPNPVNRILLLSSDSGFPEDFHVDISLDNEIWTTLFEVKKFKAESRKKYFWDINVVRAKYIRIEARTVMLRPEQYGLKLEGIEICAASYEDGHVHNTGDITPYASIFQAGVVKLAKDGDDAEGKAVQGNDWRLRDATTIFKGITQLAADGDTGEGLSVQASDSRLKPATETRSGMVRLAGDGEIQPGAAVQGNDSRLRAASTEQPGIVRICPDGLYSPQCVISGNDPRVHKAATERFGIVRLAADGEPTAGSVVQADDKRLRDGSDMD